MNVTLFKSESLVKTFIKYVFLASLFFCGTYYVEAATLSVSPQTGVYKVGSVFTASVRINTKGAPINAAEGGLRFDSQKLRVISVSKGSIFNLWTADPSFSNSAGTIIFGGGSPSGYTGNSGSVMNITFKTLTAGKASVSFTSGSVLAADGLGTNVLTSMGSAAFTIAANEVLAEPEVIIEYVPLANTPGSPKITSISHPDKTKWYKETTAELEWLLPNEVTSVRTLLDESSGTIPTKVYDTPIDSISIPDLDEGVSYFHLQFRNSDGWGRVSHYRLAVDTQNPTKFNLNLEEDSDLSSPVQTLVMTVEDEPSGVDRYSVQIDGGDTYEYTDETGSSTIKLPPLEPGHHSVIMEAYDKAGNSLIGTISFDILAFDKPKFTEYPTQINSEVIPVIKGVTRPDSKVNIRMSSLNNSDGTYIAPSEISIMSDDTGVFTFIPDGRLQNGVYELIAIAIDQHGAQSDPSDPVRIIVQDPGYIKIGSLLVGALSIIVPLFGLLVLLILLIVFFISKFKKFRSSIVKETKEALDVLDREFTVLSSVLDKHTKALTKSRKTKKLTKAEENLVNAVSEAMESSRKKVEKEISDVDNIVE